MLFCDLVSPLVVGARPRYRLQQTSVDGEAGAPSCTYRWTVRRRSDGHPIWQTETPLPELCVTAAAPGRYLLEVAVIVGGVSTKVRLALEHDVDDEPAALASGLQGAHPAVALAMRELICDLRPYIVEAAEATGPYGITARCLAAVLAIEVLAQPWPRRERDLDEVGARLSELAGRDLERSLGVGQISLMTAAMVTCDTPWLELDPRDPHEGGAQVRANCDALPPVTKQLLYTRLRWPRSNIRLAAALLSALKNRPGRYSALTREEFAADSRAMAIVASEYAGGGMDTPVVIMQPSCYGYWACHLMQGPLLQQFFENGRSALA